MKSILFGVLLFFCLLANGQRDVDSLLSSAACVCLSQSKSIGDDSFGECFMKSFQENNALLIAECYRIYKDSSDNVAQRFGLDIYKKLSVSMIFTCDRYYHTMDSLRNQTLDYITIDSAKSQIEIIKKVNSNKLTTEFYNLKGIIEFKTGRFSSAIENFDMALNIDKNNFQSMFLKAWSLEKNHHFDEAIAIYKSLADITGKYDFNIFSALAERKKKSW
ncbi:MAG: tetratricopeptide repeat protein [Bacteroidota bacterium]